MNHQRQESVALLIVRELGWDYCRRIAAPLCASLLAGLLLPWAMFRGILQIPSADFESASCYPAFLGLCVATTLICSLLAQQGVRSWLYTRPISTKFLFLWLMFVPVLTAVIVHTFANLVAGQLYGVSWPWFRPSLNLISVVLFTQYFQWRLRLPITYQVFAFFAAYGLMLYGWSLVHTVDGELQPNRPFLLMELLALAGICFYAVRQAYRVLDRIRTDGEVEYIEADAQLSSTTGATKAAPRFATSRVALKWFLWQQSKFLMTMAAVCLGIVVTALAFFTVYLDDPQRLEGVWQVAEAIDAAFFRLIFSSAFLGWIIGGVVVVGVQRPGDPKANPMSTFLSTRPVTNKSLWRYFGESIFRGSVISWLIICFYVSLSVFYASMWTGNSANLMKLISQPLMIQILVGAGIATFLIVWTCASAGASMLFFGQERTMINLVCGISVLLPLLGIWGISFPKEQAQLFSHCFFLVCGLLVLAATVFVYVIAFRRKLIDQRQILAALAAWVCVAAFCFLLTNWWVVPVQEDRATLMVSITDGWELPYRCALAASSSLCVFAFAAGPLGLDFARHR